MSADIAAGPRSRRIMIIAAAALAVAMMLAVPFFVAVDSDADFTKDEAGYCVDAKDPTDAQLLSLGDFSRSYVICQSIEEQLDMFNGAALGAPTATAETLNFLKAEGQKIESDKASGFTVGEISAEKVVITYTAVSAGTLMNPDTTSLNDKEKAAYNAIKAYLGNEVAIGDTMTVTGTIKLREAINFETPYKMLDGGKCVIAGATISVYGISDTDLTFTFKHAGAENSIRYVSDAKGMEAEEYKYEYEGDTIQVGTKYVVKNTVETSFKGDSYFTVNGKDYSLYVENEPADDREETVSSYDIFDQSSVTVSESLKTRISNLPPSADNMTVDKTYSAAESAFDDVVMDAIGKDILKLLLIIGGVILAVILIVIVLIVVLLLKRKKR